ncbi:UDP-N-acetylmuramoyl-L-alanyl-D-glutamate--2,6-diaminopimelate ligase [Alkalibacillus flavidus]|uniref:UDP-N-acetylmuramoyl-L-alanyl-D-glutamate--2, 6-diaminopimelate ligase n=1 Tax=Alkalibacillus flavidus TaxID=546021 RepID=A0ABV2KVS2_9BACI
MVLLRDLITSLQQPIIKGVIDHITILNIVDHSKQVNTGSLFVALSGHMVDGHDYIDHAVTNGATAVIGEKDIDGLDVPYIKVEDARKALVTIAKTYYQCPFDHKTIIGVTGTNGKTTTSHMISHLLQAGGSSVSLISTTLCKINDVTFSQPQTTPGVLDLYRYAYESHDDVMVIEVSSHGLDQQRVAGITFDLAVFTNLSHEHLDYHRDMGAYFKTKVKLFEQLHENGKAIINIDDSWGKRMVNELSTKHHDIITVGQSDNADMSFNVLNYQHHHDVMCHVKGESFHLPSPVLGVYNLYNLVLSIAVYHELGKNKNDLAEHLKSYPGVPGRFEQFQMKNGVHVVVDYAHTPKAIQEVLSTAREMTDHQLVHIIGFKASRDKHKRDDMINESLNYSDDVYLTIGDLDHVSQEDMVHELNLLKDKWDSNHISVEDSRLNIIDKTIRRAKPGDWIVITGQGHKTYENDNEWGTTTDQETVQYVDKLLEVKLANE